MTKSPKQMGAVTGTVARSKYFVKSTIVALSICLLTVRLTRSYRLKSIKVINIKQRQSWVASRGTVMDLKATRAQSGLKGALVRTCILALFLLTGVLLVASLNTEGILHADASSTPLISSGQPTLAADTN